MSPNRWLRQCCRSRAVSGVTCQKAGPGPQRRSAGAFGAWAQDRSTLSMPMFGPGMQPRRGVAQSLRFSAMKSQDCWSTFRVAREAGSRRPSFAKGGWRLRVCDDLAPSGLGARPEANYALPQAASDARVPCFTVAQDSPSVLDGASPDLTAREADLHDLRL